MSVENARRLRKTLTDAEQKLWSALRQRQIGGYRFRRQVPIGDFIADFACLSEGLVIEIDGGQHDANRAQDEARMAWLASRGYRVIRFWNNDVIGNLDGVLLEILTELQGRRHPPS